MITIEKALEVAKYYRNDLTQVCEYEKGYVFSNPKDADYIGGVHSPVVVLKEDGSTTNMAAFVYSGTGKELGMRDI